jgi:hypothetical protein
LRFAQKFFCHHRQGAALHRPAGFVTIKSTLRQDRLLYFANLSRLPLVRVDLTQLIQNDCQPAPVRLIASGDAGAASALHAQALHAALIPTPAHRSDEQRLGLHRSVAMQWWNWAMNSHQHRVLRQRQRRRFRHDICRQFVRAVEADVDNDSDSRRSHLACQVHCGCSRMARGPKANPMQRFASLYRLIRTVRTLLVHQPA